jgi:hypothetical protein
MANPPVRLFVWIGGAFEGKPRSQSQSISPIVGCLNENDYEREKERSSREKIEG